MEEKWRLVLGLDNEEEKDCCKSKWIISDLSLKIYAWEVLMSIPMWHSMCINPVVIVWPYLHEKYIYGIWFFEMFWIADFFLSFFRSKPD